MSLRDVGIFGGYFSGEGKNRERRGKRTDHEADAEKIHGLRGRAARGRKPLAHVDLDRGDFAVLVLVQRLGELLVDALLLLGHDDAQVEREERRDGLVVRGPQLGAAVGQQPGRGVVERGAPEHAVAPGGRAHLFLWPPVVLVGARLVFVGRRELEQALGEAGKDGPLGALDIELIHAAQVVELARLDELEDLVCRQLLVDAVV